jgi:hypothetical protein
MDKKLFEKLLAENPTSLAVEMNLTNINLQRENTALKRRCDPLLAEHALLGNLSMPCSAENSEPLQVGAMLTLVAMYDRKLPRAEFVKVAEAVTALYEMLGRLCIAESVKHMMEKGVFTKGKIDDAAKELIAYGEAERHKIVKHMELIQQCPTSEDTKH